MARAPAHVLPRPASSVHLIAAARLDRDGSVDLCASLHPSILPPRRTSDSVHSGSKEGPSLSQSTVGMGFLRQLEPLGTCSGSGSG